MGTLWAGLAALSQFTAALLGLVVTMMPPLSKGRRATYLAGFIVVGVVGFAAVLLQARQADVDQDALQTQIKKIGRVDNFVYFRAKLEGQKGPPFLFTTEGNGPLDNVIVHVVPGFQTKAEDPEYYSLDRAYRFPALGPGFDAPLTLQQGQYRVEIFSPSTGHYNEYLSIAQIDGRWQQDIQVIRGGKRIF